MKKYQPVTDFDAIKPILSQISFLGGFSEGQRAVVFRLMEKHNLKKGECISRVDEEPSHIYVVAKGEVDLVDRGLCGRLH